MFYALMNTNLLTADSRRGLRVNSIGEIFIIVTEYLTLSIDDS